MAWKDKGPLSWSKRVWSDEENPLTLLEQGVNSLFREVRDNFAPGFSGTFNPRINYGEDNEKVYIEAELPGLGEKDIEVSLTKDSLTIRGEKKQQQERWQGRQVHVVESSHGYFERLVPIRSEIDEDKVDASFKDGVLRVTLNKTERAKSQAKKITIRTEG